MKMLLFVAAVVIVVELKAKQTSLHDRQQEVRAMKTIRERGLLTAYKLTMRRPRRHHQCSRLCERR